MEIILLNLLLSLLSPAQRITKETRQTDQQYMQTVPLTSEILNKRNRRQLIPDKCLWNKENLANSIKLLNLAF